MAHFTEEILICLLAWLYCDFEGKRVPLWFKKIWLLKYWYELKEGLHIFTKWNSNFNMTSQCAGKKSMTNCMFISRCCAAQKEVNTKRLRAFHQQTYVGRHTNTTHPRAWALSKHPIQPRNDSTEIWKKKMHAPNWIFNFAWSLGKHSVGGKQSIIQYKS